MTGYGNKPQYGNILLCGNKPHYGRLNIKPCINSCRKPGWGKPG